MTRRLLALAAVVLAALLIVGRCVPQDPDVETYREQARLTVGTALSEVATVRLTLRAAQRDRMFESYAEITVRRSETTLSTTIDSFTSMRPPASQDALATATSDLLSHADDVVTEARVCVERSAGADCPDLGHVLGRVAAQLEQAEGRLR
jgi:hypothetical protein